MTVSRQDLKRKFLAEAGWGDCEISILAGDASLRSYDRLVGPDGRTAVLMNAPPDQGEDPAPFVKITEILRSWSYSAPEIIAADINTGFLLIEDLGDALFAKVCQSDPDTEEALYTAATNLLADLSDQPVPQDIAPYDLKTYCKEALLAVDWYLAAAGATAPSGLRQEYQSLITQATSHLTDTKPVLVLRDYHAENLIWLPDRSALARVGLLDYQDALIGHPAYDLVSLLEDARRDTSPKLRERMIELYLARTGSDHTSFRNAYDILGAQRNLKIIGIFTRLYKRDGKAQYLSLIPRVWTHLQRDLQNAKLADLKAWVDAHLPNPTSEVLDHIRRAS